MRHFHTHSDNWGFWVNSIVLYIGTAILLVSFVCQCWHTVQSWKKPKSRPLALMKCWLILLVLVYFPNFVVCYYLPPWGQCNWCPWVSFSLFGQIRAFLTYVFLVRYEVIAFAMNQRIYQGCYFYCASTCVCYFCYVTVYRSKMYFVSRFAILTFLVSSQILLSDLHPFLKTDGRCDLSIGITFMFYLKKCFTITY